MSNNVRILKNGTRAIENINGETMHECQYCGTWFMPKRRFVQKFCSESCRVMACKKRKVGLYGTVGGNLNDRNNVTNQSLVNKIEDLRSEINEHLAVSNEHFAVNKEIGLSNNSKLDKIKKYAEFQMLISIILPFIAEPIKKKLTSLFEKTDEPVEDLEGFENILEPLSNDIPKETRDKILNAVQAFYKAKQNIHKAKNNKGSQKG